MGMNGSGEHQTPSGSTVTAADGADTTDMDSSVNWTHGTACTEQADMVRVVARATHTAGRMGSQSTELTGPLQPPVQPGTQNCRTGESSARSMKTLPVQPTVSAYEGNTALPPVSVPMMAGCHNSPNMAVPSTGMDVLYGSSDLAPVPLRLFRNVMTLHWHNMNVNKMSTLRKLRPTNAGDIVMTLSLGNRSIQTFHWTRLFSHTLLL